MVFQIFPQRKEKDGVSKKFHNGFKTKKEDYDTNETAIYSFFFIIYLLAG